MSNDDQKQRVFLALADPTRRQMIEILSAVGDKTPTELARDLPMTRQGVSKHLHILADANLVTVRREGRERYYSLQPQHLTEAVSWIDHVRAQWNQRLAALADYLDRTTETED